MWLGAWPLEDTTGPKPWFQHSVPSSPVLTAERRVRERQIYSGLQIAHRVDAVAKHTATVARCVWQCLATALTKRFVIAYCSCLLLVPFLVLFVFAPSPRSLTSAVSTGLPGAERWSLDLCFFRLALGYPTLRPQATIRPIRHPNPLPTQPTGALLGQRMRWALPLARHPLPTPPSPATTSHPVFTP
jgi:hypothetical protein